MSCSLAVCIATYERPESVQSFLTFCAASYAAAGVDIYFYDSSRGDETETVVAKWRDKDPEHIRYVRLSSDMMLNEKIYWIFHGEGWEKKYDFMVLSNDSSQFSAGAMSHLMEVLSPELDIAIYHHKATRKFVDYQTFFEECGSYVLHMGNTFLNVHTMLEEIDWEKYKTLFFTSEQGSAWLNMGVYYTFYFTRILELDHFTAAALSYGNQRTLRWSIAERQETIYDRDMIAYLCNAWPRTYGRLPKEYKRRWAVCADAASDYAAGKLSDFFLYSRKGTFNWKEYIKYWNEWPKVTKIPRLLLAIPAIIPRKIQMLWHNTAINRRKSQLESFCREHQRIVIYGAGTSGVVAGKYLSQLGFEFEAYCATRKKPGKDFFHGHPVYEFETLYLKDNESIGYVLAVRQGSAKELLKMLRKCLNKKDVFYYPMFIADIRDELGYSAYSGFYI